MIKPAVKEESLQTEFLIAGQLETVVEIIHATVSSNKFKLEPYRFSDHSKDKKAFHVMHIDEKNNRMNCCGALELVKQNNHETLVRLDSTKGTSIADTRQNTTSLERVFYVILQQLIQRGMYRLNK